MLVNQKMISSVCAHVQYSTYYKPIMYYKPTPLQLEVLVYRYNQGRIEPPKAARGHATSNSANRQHSAECY